MMRQAIAVRLDGVVMVGLLWMLGNGGQLWAGPPPLQEESQDLEEQMRALLPPPPKPVSEESQVGPGLQGWQDGVAQQRAQGGLRRLRQVVLTPLNFYWSPTDSFALMGERLLALECGHERMLLVLREDAEAPSPVERQWSPLLDDREVPADQLDYDADMVVAAGGAIAWIGYNLWTPPVCQVIGGQLVDPSTGVLRWEWSRDLPTSFLDNCLLAFLPDKRWDNEWDVIMPIWRGPWVVHNGHGTRIGSARVPEGMYVGPDATDVRREGERLLVASTFLRQRQEWDGKWLISDYGSDEVEAALFRFQAGREDQVAEVEVARKEDLPVLPFLQPGEWVPQETRDPLILPGGKGMVYVWRGHRTIPAQVDYRAAETYPEAIYRTLPLELFDLKALMVRWEDGSTEVLDYLVGYSERRELRDLANPYVLCYLWAPDADGLLAESRPLPETNLAVGSAIPYRHQALHLETVAVSPSGWVYYRRGWELWRVDLREELRRRGGGVPVGTGEGQP